MRVVEQTFAHQTTDVVRVFNLLVEFFQHGLEIEHSHRIAAVDCAGERHQPELQAEGVAVAADLALVQFQLVQHGAYLLDGDAVGGNALERVEHEALHGFGLFRVAAFQTAAEDDLALRILDAAERRGRGAEIRGLQCQLQGRGAVVEQHAVQQMRFQQFFERR